MAGGHRAASHEANINLVPMIDILTVLVLYLLVGSIASHLAILKLNLPAPNQPLPTKPPLEFQIAVQSTEIDVGDTENGLLQKLPKLPNGDYNLAALGDFLAKLKGKYPEHTSIIVLMAQDLSYETLVKVMDTARVYPADESGTAGLREMFPNISIGDAPNIGEPAALPPTTAPPIGSGTP
jgi:biopolymer transport protein ExbD